MISYKWVNDIDEFKLLSKEWDQKIMQFSPNNPFILSSFIILWWEVFQKKTYELKIFTITENDEIVGGIPLYIRERSIGIASLKVLSIVGDSFANITDPFYISNDLFTECFFKALQQNRDWDILFLPRIKNRINVNSNINRIKAIYSSRETNPVITVNSDSIELLQKKGKKLRENVNYYRRKLKKIGEVELLKIEDAEVVMDINKHHIDFSISGMKARNRESAYLDQMYCDFFNKISLHFADNNMLDLYILRVNGELVATAYGYKFGNGFGLIFTAFNPRFSKLSPGYTLIYELINLFYKKGIPYIDLYSGGDVFYKNKWADEFLPLYKLFLFNMNVKGYISYYIYSAMMKVRRFMKSIGLTVAKVQKKVEFHKFN